MIYVSPFLTRLLKDKQWGSLVISKKGIEWIGTKDHNLGIIYAPFFLVISAGVYIMQNTRVGKGGDGCWGKI